MATNEFLPFANGGGANVATQADYSANAGYSLGYQAGVAQSKFLNKTWRQSSMMASALAQYISDTTGQDVLDDGVLATLQGKIALGLAGRLIGVQIINDTASYVPTAGMRFVIVEVQGGGGGGGGSGATSSGTIAIGGGGGSGSYAKGRFTSANVGASVLCTIGGGGAGVSSGQGVAGGLTTFGSLVSVPGGGGGVAGGAITTTSIFSVNGGSGGGTPTGGNILNALGNPGGNALNTSNSSSSGLGSGSPISNGLGVGPSVGQGNPGQAGRLPGAGGSGACSAAGVDNARAGGAGFKGQIMVWEYT